MNHFGRRILFLACEIVINEARPHLRGNIEMKAVEAGLHIQASKLKDSLRELVDEADGVYDPIVLGYGLCSNAVVGLRTEKSTLIALYCLFVINNFL